LAVAAARLREDLQWEGMTADQRSLVVYTLAEVERVLREMDDAA